MRPRSHTPRRRIARLCARPLRRLALVAGLLALGMAGCAWRAEAAPSHHASAAPRNGAVLSRQKLSHAGTAEGAVLYRIFYECRGAHVEAYMTVPSTGGLHPLLVNLHGGYLTPQPDLTHFAPSYTYPAWGAAMLASASYAILYPEYQGYRQSSGDVGGLYTDTEHAICGVQAADALGHINPRQLYLLGYSLGGGVALKMAGVLPQVRAVVAVSPHVGLRIVLPWLQAHAQSAVAIDQFSALDQAYLGPFSASAPVMARESISVGSIRAPVLLLQGTAYHHVAWQTVQQLDRALAADGKIVKLVLYPGGHHALLHANSAASMEQATTWFEAYGLSPSPGQVPPL